MRTEVRLNSREYSNKQIIGIMERLAGYKNNTGIIRRLLFKPQTKTHPTKKTSKHTHTQEHNTKQKQTPPQTTTNHTKTAPTPQNNKGKKNKIIFDYPIGHPVHFSVL